MNRKNSLFNKTINNWSKKNNNNKNKKKLKKQKKIQLKYYNPKIIKIIKTTRLIILIIPIKFKWEIRCFFYKK